VNLFDRIETVVRDREAAAPRRRFFRVENTMSVAALALRERAIPFWPIAKIEDLQRRRVQEMVRHAYATVPFYRSVMAERGIRPEDIRTAADLSELPVISGRDLAEDPMRFVSAPFRSEGREVFKTSGSTSGLRKPIFWDHASLLIRAARGERDRVIIARLAGETWSGMMTREYLTNEWRHTLARLVGVRTPDHQRLLILPADFSSRTQRVIWKERSSFPRRPVHYHHLPPAVPPAVAAAHIAAIRPRVVFSFGSWAEHFFRFLEASGTAIPMPRLWVYISDRLSPEGREIAERRGSTVYSVYGAMEAGTIGFQCEQRNGFHLNIDLCVVRTVDGHGRDVPAGEPGDIVISALDNRAMALLNFSLGDRAVLSAEPCPCGRSLPLLARLEGRRSESVRLADGRELSSLTLEGLFASELRRTIQAQISQQAPGCLHWRIVPFPTADRDALRAALLARGRRALGVETTLTVEFVDNIPRTTAGKFVRGIVSAAATETQAPGTPVSDALR
jgi:phenylacetate-coenzyme A ligase PaaK-like adenylate-forming protein